MIQWLQSAATMKYNKSGSNIVLTSEPETRTNDINCPHKWSNSPDCFKCLKPLTWCRQCPGSDVHKTRYPQNQNYSSSPVSARNLSCWCYCCVALHHLHLHLISCHLGRLQLKEGECHHQTRYTNTKHQSVHTSVMLLFNLNIVKIRS